jgi:transglutaminase-like putative cysteine protease
MHKTLKKSVFIAGWLLCSAFILTAQDGFYPVFTIPEALQENANCVVRFEESVAEIDEDLSITFKEHTIVTILNEKGKYRNMIGGNEDKFTTIKKIEGKIYDPMGNLIRKSEKSDIEIYGGNSEYEMTDNRSKSLQLTNSSYPYTVEFYMETKSKSFFMIPSYSIQNVGESVQTSSFSLITPDNYAFKWKMINADVPFKQTIEKDKVVWKCSFNDLKANPVETYDPYFDRTYAQLLIAPEQIAMEDYQGDMKTWKGVGEFYYNMNKDRDQVSPAMEQQIKSLVATAKNNREKIDLLYRHLQKNHRYVSIQLGIGGWQTLNAQFVEQKKYGDCKALSNYMKAMLKVVGIPAYQALVYAGGQYYPKLYDDMPTPRFNHVILYVPGEEMWLECTSQQNPTGYLGNFTANRQVLLLTPEGGKLVKTPLLDAAQNQRQMTAKIQLDDAGNAIIQSKMVYSGNLHDDYRGLAKEKDAKEREKSFAEGLGLSIMAFKSFAIAAAETKPETTIEAAYETRNYAKSSGKRVFVPITKIKPSKLTLPADTARFHDLYMPETYTLQDTFSFTIPLGFKVENTPRPAVVQSPYGTYELTVAAMDHQEIKAIRRMVVLPVSVAAKQYNEVRKFYLDINKADGVQVVLIRE